MNDTDTLLARDLKHVWHPCSQMKDFEQYPPLIIEKAQGAYLYTNKGPIIDAISSWWCKSLGHAHPSIQDALKKQLSQFEHIIGANTTYPELVELSEELSKITGNQHAFYASDGATAVEIAMKLSIHGMQLKGYKNRTHFISLKNAYHGESIATMSVSDLGIYKAPYQNLGVPCYYIDPIPYINNTLDSLWYDAEAPWQEIELKLDPIKDTVCAVLVEPIVQGAAGMRCYSADFLKKLATWAKKNDIYLIADEIMTGIGRTGTWLASEHAQIQPDLICLSKGLSSGALPLSCVMINHELFSLFYSDYDEGKSFLHSNTYSANPLAVCAALATIKTIQREEILKNVEQISQLMMNNLNDIAVSTNKISSIRGVGAIVAADLEIKNESSHSMAHRIYEQALELGALIRPIGNTLYWLPPLNSDLDIIGKISEITLNCINRVYR